MDKVIQKNTPLYGDSSILWQGFVKDLDDSVVTVYSIQLPSFMIWFVATEIFLENQCDFNVEISNFGLRKKSDAEYPSKPNRMVFPQKEINDIKNRIEEFFLSEEKKDFFPFNVKKAKLVGVIFKCGWILTE